MRPEYFDKDYFETEGKKNGLSDYFEKQKTDCINVADRIENLTGVNTGPKKNVGAKILELGCAYGQTTKALADRHYTAWGCDISDYAIEEGKKRLDFNNLFSASLEEKNLSDIVRQNTGIQEFDVIFSCITLEHLHQVNIPILLGELFKLTKKGGWHYHAIDLERGNDETHFCILPAPAWVYYFTLAGFTETPMSWEQHNLNYFLFRREK